METVNQETTNTSAQAETAGEKTYTQDEINKIVQDRVARERAKYEGYEDFKEKAAKFDEMEEANKSELQKAQEKVAEYEKKINAMEKEKNIHEMRTKVAQEKGIPVDLLTGETEEACNAQADAIKNYATQSTGYPTVKDGGEPTSSHKVSTQEQFKRWAEKQL